MKWKLRAPTEAHRNWATVVTAMVATAALVFSVWFGVANLRANYTALNAADRPWVGLVQITFDPVVAGSDVKTTVFLRNVGRSPAIRVRVFVEEWLIESSQPRPAIPDLKDLDHAGIVTPGTEMTVTLTLMHGAKRPGPLTESDAAAIKSGAFEIWVTGQVQYEDSFGGKHRTTFQARYEPSIEKFATVGESNEAN